MRIILRSRTKRGLLGKKRGQQTRKVEAISDAIQTCMEQRKLGHEGGVTLI